MTRKWSIEQEAEFVVSHLPPCPCGKLRCDKCTEVCPTVEPNECRMIERAKSLIGDLLNELKNKEEHNGQ